MRNIYLIDFENVGSDGLSGILNLTADDRVIIFYSTKSNRLTMRAHILIGRAEAQFTYYEATVGGKNALDHQLSTYLGYLIGTSAADRYYIVSRDNGYRFASNFWNDLLKTRAVFCIDTIKNAQRTTERLLRKDQVEETTLRTAEDLHDEDLDEGTGEPVEEQPEPIAESQTAVVTPETLPVTAEAAELAEEPADVAEAAEAPEVPEASEEPKAEAPEATAIADPAEAPVAEPEAPTEAEPAAFPAGPSPELMAAVMEQAVESVIRVKAAFAAKEEAKKAAEAPEIPETAEAPAAEETAILFPENEIDDVPDPNRPHSNNNNNRRPYRADNRRNNNRKPRPDRKNQNFHKDEQKHTEAATAEPENPAEKPVWIEKPDTPKPLDKQRPRREPKPKAEKPEGKAEEKPEVVVDEAWLNGLLAPYPKLVPEKIREMIAGRKKQILCNSLRKQLGQEKGLALYSEIKKVAWK